MAEFFPQLIKYEIIGSGNTLYSKQYKKREAHNKTHYCENETYREGSQSGWRNDGSPAAKTQI